MVAAGGVVGTLLRAGLELLIPTALGRFPWATLAANVIGSLALGTLLAALLARARSAGWAWAFWGAGVLGSFTTFSTFSMEWIALGRGGQPWLAAGYVLTSMAAGLLAAALGVGLGRRLWRRDAREAALEGRP